ncbi:MAG: hypothetical protein NTY29_06445, partial [Proteobacteria bacterium]|nr:hypothetical protein [Pseudomonadota bacterium]
EVKNLAARCENSRAYGATLRLDPGRQYKPVLIETMFTDDLSQLPSLVRLIPVPAIKNDLSLIKSPRGTAEGKFKLSEENNAYITEFDISRLSLQADYRTFPAPLELRRGIFIYQDRTLSFRELSGRLGSAPYPSGSLAAGLAGRSYPASRQASACDMTSALLSPPKAQHCFLMTCSRYSILLLPPKTSCVT